MKTARRTPADRDRAVARLRTITIGTGLAGVVAVGGFAAIAARSYDGTSTGVTTAAIVTANADADADTDTITPTSTSAATIGGTATVQATAAPTAATGTAHAATGSS